MGNEGSKEGDDGQGRGGGGPGGGGGGGPSGGGPSGGGGGPSGGGGGGGGAPPGVQAGGGLTNRDMLPQDASAKAQQGVADQERDQGIALSATFKTGGNPYLLTEETAELQRAEARIKNAITDLDGAIDTIEKESLRLFDATTAGSIHSAGVSERAKLENLMTKREALLLQKRQLVDERHNIRSLIAHDFEALDTAMNAARNQLAAKQGKGMAGTSPFDDQFDFESNLPSGSAFSGSGNMRRAGPLTPNEAQVARLLPKPGQQRTIQDVHALNRAKINYYKGQLRDNSDLLHSNSLGGQVSLADFLEAPDPVEIEEAEALEKEAELKQRADHLQSVIREKNELLKHLVKERGSEAAEAISGGSGGGVAGSQRLSQETLHDIAEHSVEKMIQEGWKDRVDKETEREFKDLKDQLQQVREQHRDERFRSMLQELQDLRSDPSLQVYYDAPTLPIDVALDRRDRFGGVIEGGDILNRGYLQADYLNEDTIKGNIRTILSEGVYASLGVHRDDETGEVVLDALHRPRKHTPLMGAQRKVVYSPGEKFVPDYGAMTLGQLRIMPQFDEEGRITNVEALRQQAMKDEKASGVFTSDQIKIKQGSSKKDDPLENRMDNYGPTFAGPIAGSPEGAGIQFEDPLMAGNKQDKASSKGSSNASSRAKSEEGEVAPPDEPPQQEESSPPAKPFAAPPESSSEDEGPPPAATPSSAPKVPSAAPASRGGGLLGALASRLGANVKSVAAVPSQKSARGGGSSDSGSGSGSGSSSGSGGGNASFYPEPMSSSGTSATTSSSASSKTTTSSKTSTSISSTRGRGGSSRRDRRDGIQEYDDVNKKYFFFKDEVDLKVDQHDELDDVDVVDNRRTKGAKNKGSTRRKPSRTRKTPNLSKKDRRSTISRSPEGRGGRTRSKRRKKREKSLEGGSAGNRRKASSSKKSTRSRNKDVAEERRRGSARESKSRSRTSPSSSTSSISSSSRRRVSPSHQHPEPGKIFFGQKANINYRIMKNASPRQGHAQTAVTTNKLAARLAAASKRKEDLDIDKKEDNDASNAAPRGGVGENANTSRRGSTTRRSSGVAAPGPQLFYPEQNKNRGTTGGPGGQQGKNEQLSLLHAQQRHDTSTGVMKTQFLNTEVVFDKLRQRTEDETNEDFLAIQQGGEDDHASLYSGVTTTGGKVKTDAERLRARGNLLALMKTDVVNQAAFDADNEEADLLQTVVGEDQAETRRETELRMKALMEDDVNDKKKKKQGVDSTSKNRQKNALHSMYGSTGGTRLIGSIDDAIGGRTSDDFGMAEGLPGHGSRPRFQHEDDFDRLNAANETDAKGRRGGKRTRGAQQELDEHARGVAAANACTRDHELLTLLRRDVGRSALKGHPFFGNLRLLYPSLTVQRVSISEMKELFVDVLKAANLHHLSGTGERVASQDLAHDRLMHAQKQQLRLRVLESTVFTDERCLVLRFSELFDGGGADATSTPSSSAAHQMKNKRGSSSKTKHINRVSGMQEQLRQTIRASFAEEYAALKKQDEQKNTEIEEKIENLQRQVGEAALASSNDERLSDTRLKIKMHLAKLANSRSRDAEKAMQKRQSPFESLQDLAVLVRAAMEGALVNAYDSSGKAGLLLQGNVSHILKIVSDEITTLVVNSSTLDKAAEEIRQKYINRPLLDFAGGYAPGDKSIFNLHQEDNQNHEEDMMADIQRSFLLNYEVHAANLLLSTLVVVAKNTIRTFFEEHQRKAIAYAQQAAESHDVFESMETIPVYPPTGFDEGGSNNTFGSGMQTITTGGANAILQHKQIGLDINRIWERIKSLFDRNMDRHRLKYGWRDTRVAPVVTDLADLKKCINRTRAACTLVATTPVLNSRNERTTSEFSQLVTRYFSLAKTAMSSITHAALRDLPDIESALGGAPMSLELERQFVLQHVLIFAKSLEAQLQVVNPRALQVQDEDPTLANAGRHDPLVLGAPLVSDAGALEFGDAPGTVKFKGAGAFARSLSAGLGNGGATSMHRRIEAGGDGRETARLGPDGKVAAHFIPAWRGLLDESRGTVVVDAPNVVMDRKAARFDQDADFERALLAPMETRAAWGTIGDDWMPSPTGNARADPTAKRNQAVLPIRHYLREWNSLAPNSAMERAASSNIRNVPSPSKVLEEGEELGMEENAAVNAFGGETEAELVKGETGSSVFPSGLSLSAKKIDRALDVVLRGKKMVRQLAPQADAANYYQDFEDAQNARDEAIADEDRRLKEQTQEEAESRSERAKLLMKEVEPLEYRGDRHEAEGVFAALTDKIRVQTTSYLGESQQQMTASQKRTRKDLKQVRKEDGGRADLRDLRDLNEVGANAAREGQGGMVMMKQQEAGTFNDAQNYLFYNNEDRTKDHDRKSTKIKKNELSRRRSTSRNKKDRAAASKNKDPDASSSITTTRSTRTISSSTSLQTRRAKEIAAAAALRAHQHDLTTPTDSQISRRPGSSPSSTPIGGRGGSTVFSSTANIRSTNIFEPRASSPLMGKRKINVRNRM